MHYLFFSHLIFVITWDQNSLGDRSFLLCFITGEKEESAIWAQTMMHIQSQKKKKELHAQDVFNETVLQFPVNQWFHSVMKSQKGRNCAIHTCNDVNKFYLPTFPNTSHCQWAHGGSLSQRRSSLWISLSHLPLEDSPLVPITNTKVKHSWDAGFTATCHTAKNNRSASGSE